MRYFVAQIVLFIPFFLIWVKDCKRIGREKLAIGLGDRFLAWVLFFPIWIIPFLK